MLVFDGGLLLAASIACAAHDPGGHSARGLSSGEGPRALAHEGDEVFDAAAKLKRDGQTRAACGRRLDRRTLRG